MKIEKNLKYPYLAAHPFLSWGQRSIFTVMNIVKSQESHWLTVLNFDDS
jgi:hypothetical protein